VKSLLSTIGLFFPPPKKLPLSFFFETPEFGDGHLPKRFLRGSETANTCPHENKPIRKKTWDLRDLRWSFLVRMSLFYHWLFLRRA